MTNTHRLDVNRRTLLRGAAFTSGAVALGGALSALGATSASAATGTDVQAASPELYWRGAGNACRPSSPGQVLVTWPRYIVVHPPATANSTDYSLDHALRLSKSIQDYHMDSNRWIDPGQQLTISRRGYVMVGRDQTPQAIAAGRHVVGAHVANNNSTCIGIDNEGLYTRAEPT